MKNSMKALAIGSLLGLLGLALGCGDEPGPPSVASVPDTGGSVDGGNDTVAPKDIPEVPDSDPNRFDGKLPPGDDAPLVGEDGEQSDAPVVGEDAPGPCEVAPYPPGCSCAGDEECQQPGYCVSVDGSKKCAAPCVEDCPAGQACVGVSFGDADVVFLCLPNDAKLCQPCGTHSDCQAQGQEQLAACLDYGEDGSFCGIYCSSGADCPDGYTCDEAALANGTPTTQCKLDGGAGAQCACNDLGKALGLVTECSVSNGVGVCMGERSCGADGLTECNAAEPATEICDLADNDCNDIIDDIDPTTPCLATNTFGSCPGTSACVGGDAICVTDTPATPEVCDGLDNDCNDVIDDDFSDLDEDGIADCVDDDKDGDEIPNDQDNCPDDANADQSDVDNDTLGDVCDPDADDDTVPNEEDCDPLDPTVSPLAEEVCDGKDNDCDELTDEDLCDDENACTLDACNPVTGECAHAWPPLEGEPCDADGDGCTGPDQCALGFCQPGPAAKCGGGAGGSCFEDGCQPTGSDSYECVSTQAAQGSACEDGDPCTQNDVCDAAGICTSGASAGEGCCTTSADCNDENPCTLDVCDKATATCKAVTVADETPCNADGDGCTQGDKCLFGECFAGAPATCPDTGDACLKLACSSTGDETFACQPKNTTAGTVCDDGDPCTLGDGCDGDGGCNAGPIVKKGCCQVPADCDDGNPCTLDTCNGATNACANLVAGDGTPCDFDGSGCTVDDACTDGVCSAGAAANCAPSALPCFATQCVTTGANDFACETKPKNGGTACDDQNVCTAGESCDGSGNCAGATTLPGCCQVNADCDDQDPCTKNVCDVASGNCSQSNMPDGTACNADGDGCTEGDSCSNGVCQAGAAVKCPPISLVCQVNSCVPTGPSTYGCQATPASAGVSCSDQNPCTVDDQCDGKASCLGNPSPQCCQQNSDCDDNNPCTGEICNVQSGQCSNPVLPDTTSCNADNNGCTVGDHCATGVCVAGDDADCSEFADTCNDAGCESTSNTSYGCTKTPKSGGTGCDDGLFCTVGDACDGAGNCGSGSPKDCADDGFGGPCTPAYCDELANACLTTVAGDGAACDDGDACTAGSTCQTGTCQGGQNACGEEPVSHGINVVGTGQGTRGPQMAALPGARYVTRFDGQGQGGHAFRLSDAVGSRENEENQLAKPNYATREFGSMITATKDGGFLIPVNLGTNSGECITSKIDYSGNTALFHFDKDGNKLAEKVFVGYSNSCDDSFNDRIDPFSVPLAFSDGTAGVVFSADGTHPSSWDGQIRYYAFDAGLNVTGSSELVGKSNLNGVHQMHAAVVPDGTNRFITAWFNQYWGLRVQRFLKTGAKDMANYVEVWLPDPCYAAAANLRVATRSDGRFVVAFNATYQATSEIWAQRFYSDGSKQGAAVQLNIGPPGTQNLGGFAYFADGGFVAVYEDTTADNNGYGVRAQLFDKDAKPVGAPITVNTQLEGDQRFPAVVVLDSDEFVVSFIDGGVAMTRRFQKDGTPELGRREHQANETGTGPQAHPAAATLGDNALVVWDGPQASLDGGEIFARVVAKTGAAVGKETLVNSGTTGWQRDPQVATAGANALVVWSSEGLDGSSDGVAARVLGADGKPAGKELTVNTTTAGYQREPDVAFSPAGKALVVWTGQNPAGDSVADVYGRQVDASGEFVSSETVLNSTLSGVQEGATVVALGAGQDYAVAWQSPAQTGREIRMRRISANGVAVGSDFVVSSSPFLYTDQRNPDVGATTAGQVVVCFEVGSTVPADSFDLACRVFKASDLSAVTGDFAPNVLTIGQQLRPAVSATVGGGFAVAWDSEFVDSTGFGAQLARFDAGGNTIGRRTMLNRTWVFNQRAPVVTPLGVELFVAWEGEAQDGDQEGIFYRVLP